MRLTNHNFLILLSYIIVLLLLSSCGGEDSRWIKTEKGVRIFLSEDPSLFSFMDEYEWSGDTTYYGLAMGKGKLTVDDGKKTIEKGSAYFGSMKISEDDKTFRIGHIEEGKLQGFGVRGLKDGLIVIGDFKKDEAKGEGIILQNKKLIYKGKLKHNLPNGEGISYYQNGVIEYRGDFSNGKFDGTGIQYNQDKTLLYNGKYNNGKYDGYGELTIYLNDSTIQLLPFIPTNQAFLYDIDGNPKYNLSKSNILELCDTLNSQNISISILERHVYNNGNISKSVHSMYDRLNEQREKYTKSEYLKISNRILSWEKHYIWMYIGIGLSFLIILLVNDIILDEKEFKSYTGKTIDNIYLFTRKNKWSVWPAYIIWILFGWAGYHRAYLKSNGAYVYGGLLAILIMLNARQICLFLFWPSTWNLWNPSIYSIICLCVISLCLFFDIFWIAWRVYILNHKFYRHDVREKDLILKRTTDIQILYEATPSNLKGSLTRFDSLLNKTKTIQKNKYDGPRSSFNIKRLANAVLGDDKWGQFELERLNSLKAVLSDFTAQQDIFCKNAEYLGIYLQEARINAWRNLSLAKELLIYAQKKINKKRKVNSEKQYVTQDREIRANVPNIDISTFNIPNIKLGIDVEDTVTNLVKTSESLYMAGLKGPWALGIGAATAIISGVVNAIQKANILCEQAEESCLKITQALNTTTKDIVRTQADILRAVEILAALYKANQAFMQAYVPLRDLIYGKDPSFSYFIRGGKVYNYEINTQDLVHLKQVCTEYSKINKSKL